MRDESYLFKSPQVWIMGDETRRIHLEFGNEPAARTLVAIGGVIDPVIALFKRLERKTGEAEPGRTHLSLLADRQIQAANREQVGGWAEVKIDVLAARNIGTLDAIEKPTAGGVNRNFDLNGIFSNPACNPA